jgi:hypothetical protein
MAHAWGLHLFFRLGNWAAACFVGGMPASVDEIHPDLACIYCEATSNFIPHLIDPVASVSMILSIFQWCQRWVLGDI